MKYVGLFCFVLLFVVSCKRDAPVTEEETPAAPIEEPTDFGTKRFEEMTEEEMEEFKQSVKDLEQPIEGDIISFFTTEMWEFSGGISPGKSFDFGRGEWYKFFENRTYEFGLFGETLTRGKWELDEQEAVIKLVPDNPTMRESEWKYTTKTNSLVFSGTGTFGNQSTQFKLARTDGKPKQLGFN